MQEVVQRATCRKCGARRIDDQLGLEATPEAFVEAMVAVFREVKRVLRSDGTVWLNLGDSYAAGTKGAGGEGKQHSNAGSVMADRSWAVPPGLKPKDLVGIPWRVAFALQADGWYLRSDIIWAKPNPMPESVTDRPTKAHEYLFLLSKSPRYYYDADAVRESPQSYDRKGGSAAWTAESGHTNGVGSATFHQMSEAGRNLRSVWNIATAPYPGAHFATFPPKLVEPCIKAGTSERGVCPECGAPWVREVERGELVGTDRGGNYAGRDIDPLVKRNGGTPGMAYQNTTTGWRPSCRCAHDSAGWVPIPATVLDPFAGSGTTGMVAQRLSRRAVLIDLSVEYLRQLMERNRDLPLGLGA
jgi:DNA modification methylase